MDRGLCCGKLNFGVQRTSTALMLSKKEISVGISKGSPFGLAMFTIFINKLDEKTEVAFISFIKLVADTKSKKKNPYGRHAAERE